MKKLIIAVAAILVAAIATAAPDGADPTSSPSPGYQIPGPDGPTFPGTQTYPPWCARNMLACGFRYDPGTGTWNPRGLGDE
jgi:hypothetical protein